MSDFNLDKSEWFNVTGLERASKWLADDVASLSAYSRNIAAFDFRPDVAEKLKHSRISIEQTLADIKAVEAEYQKKRNPQLVAAE